MKMSHKSMFMELIRDIASELDVNVLCHKILVNVTTLVRNDHDNDDDDDDDGDGDDDDGVVKMIPRFRSWEVVGSTRQVRFVTSVISQDLSLSLKMDDFNVACSPFVHQTCDLGCFKCPTCAKPYVDGVWYQKRLDRYLRHLPA